MKVALRLGDKVLLFLNDRAGQKAIRLLNQSAIFDYVETKDGPIFREMKNTKLMNPIPGIMVLEDDDPRLDDYRKICRKVIEAEERLKNQRAESDIKSFVARLQRDLAKPDDDVPM